MARLARSVYRSNNGHRRGDRAEPQFSSRANLPPGAPARDRPRSHGWGPPVQSLRKRRSMRAVLSNRMSPPVRERRPPGRHSPPKAGGMRAAVHPHAARKRERRRTVGGFTNAGRTQGQAGRLRVRVRCTREITHRHAVSTSRKARFARCRPRFTRVGGTRFRGPFGPRCRCEAPTGRTGRRSPASSRFDSVGDTRFPCPPTPYRRAGRPTPSGTPGRNLPRPGGCGSR